MLKSDLLKELKPFGRKRPDAPLWCEFTAPHGGL